MHFRRFLCSNLRAAAHAQPIPKLLPPKAVISIQSHVVYGAAGTPDRCFPIESVRLVEVTGAVEADFVV